MIRQLEASHDNVIGYSLSGDVTDDEYRQMASELRDAIARHRSIRVLFRLDDLSLQSFFSALDERFQLFKEHADDVERIALVSDDTTTLLLSRLGEAIPGIELRHFRGDEEDQAWTWLE